MRSWLDTSVETTVTTAGAGGLGFRAIRRADSIVETAKMRPGKATNSTCP